MDAWSGPLSDSPRVSLGTMSGIVRFVELGRSVISLTKRSYYIELTT